MKDKIKINIRNYSTKTLKARINKKTILNHYFLNIFGYHKKKLAKKRLKKILYSVYFIKLLSNKINKKKIRKKFKDIIINNSAFLKKNKSNKNGSSLFLKKPKILKKRTINSPILNKLKNKYKITKDKHLSINAIKNYKKKFFKKFNNSKIISSNSKINKINLKYLKKEINTFSKSLSNSKIKKYKINKKYNFKDYKIRINIKK